jgi:hypothetical protein
VTEAPPELSAPDYLGGCLSNVVPALLAEPRTAPWLPAPARDARQVVLLVLDGLGWRQLQSRPEVAPTLCAMTGGPITSVAPTTTATALCSIVLGRTPAEHGVVGYRMRVGDDEVLNVLRWRTAGGDARESFPPAGLQPRAAFLGRATPVVTKSEFATTGFTTALGITDLRGWQVASSIAVEVGAALDDGEPLVYAYYDGIDRIAHAKGFGEHYDAELAAVDRLVADLAATLPADAALVVTSDHGQVDVGDRIVLLDGEILDDVTVVSGEGRFTWLHARPGRAADLLARACARYAAAGLAEVVTRDEVIARGWFGGALTPEVASRLGDVALVARQPVAFLDPADPGAAGLRCRHGSLTPDELLVPLLAVGSPA